MKIIIELVQANPDALRVRDTYGMRPADLAAHANASRNIVEFLANTYQHLSNENASACEDFLLETSESTTYDFMSEISSLGFEMEASERFGPVHRKTRIVL